MRTRKGFVSNSSSSSFILFKAYLDDRKIEYIQDSIPRLSDEGWNVEETSSLFEFSASMDNYDVVEELEGIGIDIDKDGMLLLNGHSMCIGLNDARKDLRDYFNDDDYWNGHSLKYWYTSDTYRNRIYPLYKGTGSSSDCSSWSSLDPVPPVPQFDDRERYRRNISLNLKALDSIIRRVSGDSEREKEWRCLAFRLKRFLWMMDPQPVIIVPNGEPGGKLFPCISMKYSMENEELPSSERNTVSTGIFRKENTLYALIYSERLIEMTSECGMKTETISYCGDGKEENPTGDIIPFMIGRMNEYARKEIGGERTQ